MELHDGNILLKTNFMAEIINNQKHHKANRIIRKSTKVDLTPMVDLGFLLITFFVFTTTMSSIKAMAMVSPKENVTTVDPICESCVITVLPASNNRLFYYEGSDKSPVYKMTTYSAEGLRTLLVNKKKQVEKINRDAVLIIKPGASSTFKNLINIIDESNICLYKKYYLDKASHADEMNIK